MFVLKNGEGKFLDTDYHTRYSKGIWRDKPRLYKSKQGLRSAFGEATPAVVSFLGPVPEWNKCMTKEDYAFRSDYWKTFRRMPIDKYFELIKQDGFELIEVPINV